MPPALYFRSTRIVALELVTGEGSAVVRETLVVYHLIFFFLGRKQGKVVAGSRGWLLDSGTSMPGDPGSIPLIITFLNFVFSLFV